MPELAEVETVCRGLQETLRSKPEISRVEIRRPDIRFEIPKDLKNSLLKQPVMGIRRRAKYILFDLPNGSLLCHLGMTGSWRLRANNEDLGPHDHFTLTMSDGRELIFNDPRRFGMLDWVELGQEAKHPRLKHLGAEPLDERQFSAEILFRLTRKRDLAIKVLIMNQKYIVGVGNIYASEALFRAGVRPPRPARRLSFDECRRLVDSIRKVLQEAIAAGGSTISDFQAVNGNSGYFQTNFWVYARDGEDCRRCSAKIKTKILGGRSTYWCASCQT